MVLTMLPMTALAAEGDVAQIGSTGYKTLAAAAAAASKTGDTITVLENTDISATGLTIASGKDVTLDLNGHEVKAANTNAGSIKVLGKLTLKDSTDTEKNGEGTGKITTTSTTYVSGSVDKVLITAFDGEFVMESGLIDAASGITNNSNNGQFAVGVENSTKDASVTINGGKIKAGWYAIAGNGSYSTNHSGNITVNGGILESTTDYAIYHPQAGTTTINGGVIYGQAGGIAINRGTLIVNDGTITSKGIGSTGSWGDGTGNLNNAAIHANARYGDVSVSIKNGKVLAEGNAVTIDKGTDYAATIAITGGTFSSDVTQYCAKNYYTEKNSDNSYSVKSMKEIAVAQIGDTYYKTLAAAVAAVPTDGTVTTVTLLKSVSGGGFKTNDGQNVVIDLGGNKFTSSNPTVGSAGTETNGFQFLKGSKITFKNGSIEISKTLRCAYLFQNYADLTLQDVNVDISMNRPCEALVHTMHGKVNILGNTNLTSGDTYYWSYSDNGVKKVIAVGDWNNSSYPDGTQVTVDTTGTISGVVRTTCYSNDNNKSTGKSTLTINNGHFDGAFSIDSDESYVAPKIIINGGKFDAALPATTEVKGTMTINGGHFTSDPSAYKAEGKYVVPSTEAGYTYTLTDQEPAAATVVVKDNTNASTGELTGVKDETKTAISNAMSNTSVDGVAEAVGNKDAILKEAGVTANDTADKDKVVEINVTVDVTATDATEDDNNKLTSLTFTAEPKATVKVNGTVQSEDIHVPNSYLNGQPITVKLPLPTGFDPVEIIHICSDGTRECFVSEDTAGATKTFKIDGDNCAVITITKFSKFFLNTNATVAAKIGDAKYGTLQDAIDAAKDGETITLQSGYDPDEPVTVAGKSLTIDPANLPQGKRFYPDTVSLGAYCTKAVVNGKLVISYNPPIPVIPVGTPAQQPFQEVARRFDDVPADAWFATGVYYAADNGLMNGTGNNLFSPYADTTRGMIMTILARKSGVNTNGSTPWYAAGMNWAKNAGVSDGTKPTAAITREQLVTMLFRYAALNGMDAVTLEENLGSFSDASAVSSYAVPAMNWAVGQGLVQGSNGQLRPQATASRAEVATILMRFCELLKK